MAEHHGRIGVIEAAVVVGVRMPGGGLQGVAGRGRLDGCESCGEGVLALSGGGEGAVCAGAVDAAEGATVGGSRRGLAMAGVAVHGLGVCGEGWRSAAITVALDLTLLHGACREGAIAAVLPVRCERKVAIRATCWRLGWLEVLA